MDKFIVNNKTAITTEKNFFMTRHFSFFTKICILIPIPKRSLLRLRQRNLRRQFRCAHQEHICDASAQIAV